VIGDPVGCKYGPGSRLTTGYCPCYFARPRLSSPCLPCPPARFVLPARCLSLLPTHPYCLAFPDTSHLGYPSPFRLPWPPAQLASPVRTSARSLTRHTLPSHAFAFPPSACLPCLLTDFPCQICLALPPIIPELLYLALSPALLARVFRPASVQV
jgi:hypothetical protein